MAPRPHSSFAYPTETDALLGQSRQLKHDKRPLRTTGGPDGLLSWFVAFANFLINLVVVGLGRMSGILYVVFMGMYHVNRRTASTPFAVQQAARNLFGPLAGILGQKYGVRAVTVGGGLLGAASTVVCFFLTDLNTVTLCWGLLFGICTALTTTLNQVPIDQYFERHRATAGGVAFSGGCVGAFIFPALLELLIARYGMPGTFLVMAALVLLVVPAAAVMRRPPWQKQQEEGDEENQTVDRRIPSSRINSRRPDNHSVIEETYHPILDNPEPKLNYSTFPASPHASSISFPYLRENGRTVYQFFTHVLLEDMALLDVEWTDTSPLVKELQDMHEFIVMQSGRAAVESKDEVADITETPQDSKSASSTDIVKQMILKNSRKAVLEDNPRWIFVAAKLRELADTNAIKLLAAFPDSQRERARKVLEMLQELNDMVVRMELSRDGQRQKTEDTTTVTDMTSKDIENKANARSVKSSKGGNTFLSHLKTALWMHTNPLFLLICICRGVFMLTFIPMVTVVVDFAMDKGLRRDTGQYAIAVLSLGDLVGRLCFGWINDSGLLSLPRYMLVCMLLLGASNASLPLAHDELSLLPAVLVFGALQGSLFVRHQLLVSQYMDEHEQAIGMGFINFLSGFIGFGLPSYIGYFRDTLGSYDYMMYLNGGICAVVGLLWAFEPCFNTAPRRKKGYN